MYRDEAQFARKLKEVGQEVYVGDFSFSHRLNEKGKIEYIDQNHQIRLRDTMLSGTPAVVLSEPVLHNINSFKKEEYFIKVCLKGSNDEFYVENAEHSLLDSSEKLAKYKTIAASSKQEGKTIEYDE